MGYYYDGKFSITYTEETLVSLALDANRFQKELLDAPWNAFGIDLYTSDNAIASIIYELGWESEKIVEDSEGFQIITGFIDSARYNYALDITMSWLIRHGVGLNVVLEGGDGDSWAWRQDYGETTAIKEMIYPILESELDAISILRLKLSSFKDYAKLMGNTELLESLNDFEEKTKNIPEK